jgi:hypothetical protein
VTPQYIGGGAIFSPPVTVLGVAVTATATCSTGSIVGGGYELLGNHVILDVSADVNRALNSSTWTVTASNHVVVALSSFGVQAFAVCA